MTNFEKWRIYCSTIKSPDQFIDWGFYSLIGATLQRRVWRGQLNGSPLFPNMYNILVGNPGIGKGLVLKEVQKFLQYWRLNTVDVDNDIMLSAQKHKTKVEETPLLIYCGPESTTFEQMVYDMATNTRMVQKPMHGETKKSMYFHNSITYCLEEMGSLFRKHLEDLVLFLLQAFDCGKYERKTLGRGTDAIKNCCLNLLAGTTPDWISGAFGHALLDQGFASRATFIYGMSNRFIRAKPPIFTEEQLAMKEDILLHIKKLADLFGEIKLTQEADDFIENWAIEDETYPQKRINHSPKLQTYYSRKGVRLQKLGFVIHFGESTDMTIGVEPFREALRILNQNEKYMHCCFSGMTEINPLTAVTEKIIEYLTNNGPVNPTVLMSKFYHMLPQGKKSFDEIIEYLKSTKKIKYDGLKLTIRGENEK